MFDYRSEIIALGEQALKSFVRIRLNDLGLTTSWKTGIKQFVDKEYSAHPLNYKNLYVFLQNHDEQELTLEQMDITALATLVHYCWKSNGIYNVSPEAEQLFINHVIAIRELRNTFSHYPQELTDKDSEQMYFDQLYFTSNIASFAVLFMKYKSPSDEWKIIYHKAKSLESKLHGERCLALSSTSTNDLESNEDLSSLIALAEQGNVDAQLKLGKVYYNGDRNRLIRIDMEKAYYWIRKAAMRKNAEAQYYLGKCYRDGLAIDYDHQAEMNWYKKSADQGFAPAQHEVGFNILFSKQVDFLTPQEKNEVYKWIKLSADQEYPKAVWTLNILYLAGIGVKKDIEKADMLIHKSSELGYSHATMHLAEEYEKKGELELAIEMYILAQNQGKKNIEEKIRKLKQKLSDQ